MSEVVVNLENVNIYQSGSLILQDVNFKVEKGEFVYLVGKTGTGKSSLLKTLYGELTLTEGTGCLLYTSPSPRDGLLSRMPSSA